MRFPGIIPAVTTPFASSGEIDTAALQANVRALLEARALLEPPVAALAARRGRPDPYAEELLAHMDQTADNSAHTEWNEGDRLFHRQLAVMTDNPVLVALADQIATTMDEPL